MSVYAFNENLEKVQIITLTGAHNIAAGQVGYFTWNTTALSNAGIDTNNLVNYAILDVIQSTDNVNWYSGPKTGYVYASPTSGYPDEANAFPSVLIDTYSKQITLTDYSPSNSTQAKYYKVRLIKVA